MSFEIGDVDYYFAGQKGTGICLRSKNNVFINILLVYLCIVQDSVIKKVSMWLKSDEISRHKTQFGTVSPSTMPKSSL